MYKKTRNILVVALSILLILGRSNSASENEYDRLLESYQSVLDSLNIELGTDYVMSPSEGVSYDQMVEFYNEMTLDEFEQYIRNAHEAEKEIDKTIKKPTEMRADSPTTSRSTLVQQKYCYSLSNYLYIKAYMTKNTSRKTIYTGTIASAGGSISAYPGYKVKSYTKSFSTDSSSVNVSYKCTKYLSENLISASLYTINVTYKAGGGNVYPTTWNVNWT